MPITNLPIRAIGEADLPAFKVLRLEALRTAPQAFGSDYDEWMAFPDSKWLGFIREAMEIERGRIFMAGADADPAAMLGIRRDEGVKNRHAAFIWGVYVRPQWRGQNLTDRLLQEAIAWCESVGVIVLRLTVITTNTAAIRIYHRQGFQVSGVIPQTLRIGDVYHDELMMWRHVVPAALSSPTKPS